METLTENSFLSFIKLKTIYNTSLDLVLTAFICGWFWFLDIGLLMLKATWKIVYLWLCVCEFMLPKTEAEFIEFEPCCWTANIRLQLSTATNLETLLKVPVQPTMFQPSLDAVQIKTLGEM